MLCAVGGWDGLSVTSSVEWFDPNDNAWSPGPPLTQPRKRMSVAALHGKVYVIGGDDGTKVLRSVEMFDQRTGVWSALSCMHYARVFAACTTLDGKVYAIGGQRCIGIPLDSVEVLDTTLGKWKFAASLHNKQGSPTAVTLNDSIHVLGKGQSGNQVLEIYTASSDTWRQIHTTLPLKRYFSAIALNSSIYILGGSGHAGDEGEMIQYDPKTNRWNLIPQLGSPRVGLGAAVLNGSLVAVGGHRGQKKLRSAEVFDFNSQTWTPLPDMSTSRAVLGVVAVAKLV